MCKNAYEKLSTKTDEIMIFCKFKDSEPNELLRLCISQRYCSKSKKYIPADQKKYCKKYE